MSDAHELLPCPFCGGEARYQPDHTTECRDSIWCIWCDFGMFDPDGQGSVINQWNRRADLVPAPSVTVETIITVADEIMSDLSGYLDGSLTADDEMDATDLVRRVLASAFAPPSEDKQ